MYYYLKGVVVEHNQNHIIVDVNDVGYEVLVMHPEDFPVGEEVLVYIVHVVREDEEYFVGFKNLREKDVFNKLINCKGIGPKTAIGALRCISIDEFIECIANEDVKKLKKLDGIGPKAASQIILDLKGTLVEIERKPTPKSVNQNQEDAILGLKSLGFKEKDILECFEKINDNTLSVEEYITQSLRMIRK